MNKNILYIIVFLLLLAPLSGVVSSATAQIGNDAVFGFLNLPTSARSAALGGTHVSLYNEGTSSFQVNPSYLSSENHKELILSYVNHLYDIYLGSAALSWHFDGIGTVGTGIRFVNYGDFIRTDSEGFEQGSFSSYDFSWDLAWSRNIFENLRAGIGTQFIVGSYGDYRSTAIAFSGGVYYSIHNGLTNAAVSFRHLGFQITEFDETRENLPVSLMAGVSHRLRHLPLRFNLTLHSLEQWELPVFDDESKPGFTKNLLRHARFGTEFLFSDNFHLRLGYDPLQGEELKTDRRIDLSGTAIGLGIIIRDINIDISRSSYSETGGLIQLNIGKRL